MAALIFYNNYDNYFINKKSILKGIKLLLINLLTLQSYSTTL